LIKIAIIGFGDIAEKEHLPAIHNSSEFSLVAIVERNESRHDEISKLASCSVVKTMTDAVNLGVECVILSTPPEITELLIREAINLNLHILCEKPIGIQLDSIQDLPTLAAKSLSKIQVGFTNRYVPFVQELKAIIESGELGSPLVFMMAAFDEPFNELDKDHLSRMMHFLEHGPAFTHEGSHLIDYLSYFGLQDPSQVSAFGVKTDSRFPTDNFTEATLAFRNGSVARLEVGWLTPSLPVGHIKVIGSGGRVEIIRREGSMLIDTKDRCETLLLEDTWNTIAFRNQLAGFAKLINTGQITGATLEDGIYNVQMTMLIEAKSRANT
jgi:predicted dehydrogenase